MEDAPSIATGQLSYDSENFETVGSKELSDLIDKNQSQYFNLDNTDL